MKRRNFIKRSAWGLMLVAGLSNANIVSADAVTSLQQLSTDEIETLKGIDPIVPFLYYPEEYQRTAYKELGGQPPGNNDFGCFCPLHLKMFGGRMERYYSREDMESPPSSVSVPICLILLSWMWHRSGVSAGLSG